MELFNMLWHDCHDPSILKSLSGDDRRFGERAYAMYRHELRQAQIFTLDDDALRTIIDLSQVPAERTKLRLELARLPFPTVWVEFNFRERVRYNHSKGRALPCDDTAPRLVGFLLKRDTRDEMMWSALELTSKDHQERHPGDMRAGILPAGFTIDLLGRGQFKRQDQAKSVLVNTSEFVVPMAELLPDSPEALDSRRELASWLWGYGAKGEGSDNPRDSLALPDCLSRSLDPSVEIINSIMMGGTTDFVQHVTKSFMECRGDARFLISALALLNEVPTKKVVQPPSRRSFMTSKGNRPFLSGTTVSINIPTTRPVQYIDKQLKKLETDAKKKRHRVRGHFRSFTERPGGDGWEWRYSARHNAHRWCKWIPEHERGDASLGWVEHQYAVHKKV